MAWKCKKCGEDVHAKVKATIGVEIDIPVPLDNMASEGYFADSKIREEIAEQADYTERLVESIYDDEFDIAEFTVVTYECPWCDELGNLKDIAKWEDN